ncbi:MAG: class I SAM-dependent rRNA methyltransferase, partial [Betaproteobacteria bacterium]|nr:class I SAM-dependent rRNA methyltransferase [Betaproteobacteria bacterium]
MKKMILKSGREKSLLRRHPWVFSGAVKSIESGAVSGDSLQVVAEDGRFLAYALYSERSQIVARALTFDVAEYIDDDFFRRRIQAAIAARAALAGQFEAIRLIHAESDGLPGLVVDRYGHVLVMQLLTAGMEPRRALLARLLLEATGARTIYERSDADVRALEGLPPHNGLVLGEPLTEAVLIEEAGLKMAVDVIGGHKTGFYLDQRDSRALVTDLVAALSTTLPQAQVLNTFCYTGGMSIAALRGGAEAVLSIDSSGPALALAARNATLNGFSDERAEWW